MAETASSRAAGLAFALLLAGEAVQWGAMLIGGAAYPGYDPLRQYVSELGATGAPTGPAVSWLGFMPAGVMIMGFCLIAIWLLRRNLAAVVGLLLFAWYGFGLIGSAIFPCAFECGREVMTPAQMMHDLIGGTGYLTGVAALVVTGLAAARARDAWLTPLGLVCAGVAAVGLGGLLADIELRGAAQRTLEAALAVFLLAFGWSLARGGLERR